MTRPPASSGPDRGQTNQLRLSRTISPVPVRPSPAGRMDKAHVVATAATTAKSSHAVRQLPPQRSAMGTARATPHPVPELMAARTRARRSGATLADTMSENGGEKKPPPAPPPSRARQKRPGGGGGAGGTTPPAARAPPP